MSGTEEEAARLMTATVVSWELLKINMHQSGGTQHDVLNIDLSSEFWSLDASLLILTDWWSLGNHSHNYPFSKSCFFSLLKIGRSACGRETQMRNHDLCLGYDTLQAGSLGSHPCSQSTYFALKY